MNITPFANLGNFENTPNPSLEKQTDVIAEDFSAILTNIVSGLQTPEQMFAPEAEKVEIKDVIELPPCDDTPIDKKTLFAENNLLEIPPAAAKQSFPELSELTAEFVSADFTPDLKPASHAPAPVTSLPLVENYPSLPEDSAPFVKNSPPEINEKSFVDNTLPEFLKQKDFEPVISQKIPTETRNLEKANVETPAIENANLESLWAGTHAVIKQRINDYKFEEAAKATLKTQINNLFQAQPNQKTETPAKFNDAAEIPATLFPEFETDHNHTVSNQTAPQLFQAEINVQLKTKILKFEKPVSPTVVLPGKNQKDYLPTTIPTAETTSNFNAESFPSQPEILISDVQTEIPVNSETEKPAPVNDAVVKNDDGAAIENHIDIQTPLAENSPDVQIPTIAVKPRVEDEKIKGFDITQNEVSSILKTFDKFFKKVETSLEPSDVANLQSEVPVSDSFEEISKSIKDSFAAIWQPLDSAELKKTAPNQPNGFWWNGQKTADDDGKIPVNQTNVEEIPVVKAFNAVTNQPVAEWRSFFNRTQPENSSPVKFQTESAAPIVKTEAAVTPKNSVIQAEKPGVEEIDLNNGFNFDRFLENVSKEQKIETDFRAVEVAPKKILEQVNPHLLELAALTNKTNEKHKLKMLLHPAELGAVEVTVERNQNGSLNAYFQTETDGARQALSQNIENLRDTLQQAGFQIGQMDVFHGGSSANSQQRENTGRQSAPVETFDFSRTSEKPDAAEQKSHNRLLSLLA